MDLPPEPEVLLLVPVRGPDDQTIVAATRDGDRYPLLERASHSALTSQIDRALTGTFIRQVLRLQQYQRQLLSNGRNVRTTSGMEPAVPKAEPSYLLLSDEQGGFSRFGFWLESADGLPRLVPRRYVNLVVNETTLESGNFEEIFPHELSHCLLEDLVGPLGEGPSRKMHMSVTITDYPTAFSEGFAEHFQPLVRDATQNQRLLRQISGRVPADFVSTWHSRIDQQLRTDGVKRNLFAYRKALPDSALESTCDPYQVYIDGETSATFLTGALKNGQQMLACEGVIATLFYRIVNDERLRNHYRDAAFYEQFLPSGYTGNPARRLFTPYENVNLKLFAALDAMRADGLDPHRPLMVDLLRKYAELFPDEAEPLSEIFLKTTWAATASQEIADLFERLISAGRLADLIAFQELLPIAERAFDELLRDVVAGRVTLDANVGPELWILNAEFRIPPALWERERKLSLSLNLNTATEAELMTLPGVNLDLARGIIRARRAVGFFRDLAHLFRSANLSLSLQRSISTMSEQMRHSPLFQRR